MSRFSYDELLERYPELEYTPGQNRMGLSRRASRVPISLTESEFNFILGEMGDDEGIRSVVELGTGFGMSALAFALAGKRVTTVDNWSEEQCAGGFQLAQRLWADHGVSGRVTPVRRDIDTLSAPLASCPRPDVVLIDSGHSKAELVRDLELALTLDCKEIWVHDWGVVGRHVTAHPGTSGYWFMHTELERSYGYGILHPRAFAGDREDRC
jgi:predicted O-methyltransferase YrrM